jgi:hypothetical protein
VGGGSSYSDAKESVTGSGFGRYEMTERYLGCYQRYGQ